MSDLTGDAILEASARQAELLLYDYFKHMTTLSLLTLGGVLSISQSSSVEVPFRELLPSIGMIVITGTTSLYGMEAILKARLAARDLSRWDRWPRILTSASFGMGIGLFIREVWTAVG